MVKRFTYLIGIVLFLSLVSCYGPSTLTPSGPRTIVLDGTPISEEAMGGFVSWTCHDYSNPEGILVEVGFFGVSSLEGNGFILFDGGHSGELALYYRDGLEHRWNWGPNGTDYSFVIKTDGAGAYYNFSRAEDGETIKPSDFYKCKQR